jgi:hypothetical protein
MAPEKDPFIASIEAKIAAWKTVLDSYRAALSLEGQAPDGGPATARPKTAMDLPVGVFRNKTIREAIQILLEAGRRKQTNKEIAEGLKKGGIPTTSTTFEQTVGTALFRLKKDGLVLRFDDGWDLAESYPDSLRHKMGAAKAKSPARRRKGPRKPAKAVKAIAEHPERLMSLRAAG